MYSNLLLPIYRTSSIQTKHDREEQDKLTDINNTAKVCIDRNNAFKNIYESLPFKDEFFKKFGH